MGQSTHLLGKIGLSYSQNKNTKKTNQRNTPTPKKPKQTNKDREGLGPSEVAETNNTTNLTCPQQKTHFRAKLGPQTETGANENLAIFARIWENIVFSAHTQTNFENLPFPKYIRAKLLKLVSCPFSPDIQHP